MRVHPMRTANMLAMPHFFQRPSGPLPKLRGLGVFTSRTRWTPVPIPAFLVEHPSAGAILVDTGMANAVAEEGSKALGVAAGVAYTVEMEPGWALTEQLPERGVDPMDVRTVVMTHLHYDHAGAIAEFPQATFVVDADEWRAARSGGFTKGYAHKLIDHPYDWREIDFDDPRVASFASFGRTVDLFGDGSIRLLSTPGHSKGHMSVAAAPRERAGAAARRRRRVRAADDRRGPAAGVRRGRAPLPPLAARDPRATSSRRPTPRSSAATIPTAGPRSATRTADAATLAAAHELRVFDASNHHGPRCPRRRRRAARAGGRATPASCSSPPATGRPRSPTSRRTRSSRGSRSAAAARAVAAAPDGSRGYVAAGDPRARDRPRDPPAGRRREPERDAGRARRQRRRPAPLRRPPRRARRHRPRDVRRARARSRSRARSNPTSLAVSGDGTRAAVVIDRRHVAIASLERFALIKRVEVTRAGGGRVRAGPARRLGLVARRARRAPRALRPRRPVPRALPGRPRRRRRRPRVLADRPPRRRRRQPRRSA